MVLVLLGTFSFVSRQILLESFAALEQQSTRKDVARALDALNADLDNLKSATRDNAVWDDNYAFINGEKPSFPEENLARFTNRN